MIFAGGRAIDASHVDRRRTDVLIYHSRPRLTDPLRVIGAKPAAFARWIIELLGALPGDTFDDLFPGSGGVARAWRIYSSFGPARHAEVAV